MNLDAVFKAYDIRGKVPEELTPELAFLVGCALAEFLPSKQAVAVGRDMRPDSAELAESLIRGLSSQGRQVIDIGQVTSDMIYFAVGKYNLAGGAMVTASHNPGAYNGIKLCAAGAQPIGVETGLSEIKKLVRQRLESPVPRPESPISNLESATPKDVTQAWIEHVLSFVDRNKLKPYKIAVDAGNGMAGAIIPHLASATPFKITPLFWELDGTFPNRPSDPTHSENLLKLESTVKSNDLDLGVAFDGDGDRAVMIDEKGQMVSGHILSAIITDATLSKFPGETVVIDIRLSRLVEELVRQRGGQIIRTAVGNPNIIAAMREHKAVFGAELAAHYYFKDNWYLYSGLIAMMVVLGILSESNKTLSELAAQYQTYFQSGEVNFEVTDKIGKLNLLAATFKDGEINRLDGLTIKYPEWWCNVRPSNTEPLLRLNVEAATSELLQEKTQQLLGLLEQK